MSSNEQSAFMMSKVFFTLLFTWVTPSILDFDLYLGIFSKGFGIIFTACMFIVHRKAIFKGMKELLNKNNNEQD
jgi:hypothetical protein